MKYLKIILFTLFLFVGNQINAQKIATNENGETIVVFDDGSWRYYEETDEYDQFLMKKHLKALNSKGNDEKENPTPSKNIQESISKIDVLNDKVANAQISLEDAQDEEQMLKDQIRRYKKLKNKSKVAALKTILTKKKYEVKRKKKFFKNAKNQLKYYQKEAKKGKKKHRKKNKAKKNIEDDFEVEEDTDIVGDDTNVGTKTNSSSENDYAKYSQKDDVKYTPPTFPCTFSNNESNTENFKKQLEPQLFFAYTPASMLATQNNKDEDYIHCIGQISKIKGGNLILDLTITIASENAKNEYGLIEKGSLLILKMIDKSSITTSSRRTVIGVYNEVDKSVTYEASYNIPSGMVKKLKNVELDIAKLIWSTGYEEYEIFETDFFINQLKCFK